MIIIQDRCLGFRPKTLLAVPKHNIKAMKWENSLFNDKLNGHRDYQVFLIHDQGKTKIVSSYPDEIILRIQNTFEQYLSDIQLNEVTAQNGCQLNRLEVERKTSLSRKERILIPLIVINALLIIALMSIPDNNTSPTL
jgi:hypothetical protein